MKEFDNVLYGKLKKMELENVIYTRYADDIVISYKGLGIDDDIAEKIRECVKSNLRRVHLKTNEKKERIYDINKGHHVKITGINITKDENGYRKITVGRKKKDKLYNDSIRYVNSEKKDKVIAQKIKGYEAFVLSVEGQDYELCFSREMRNIIMKQGYSSLHELISSIEV